MVLFPIAFIWLLCVMIWLVRNSLNEPEAPGEEREPPRRWPRRPRRPNDRGSNGSHTRDRAAARVSRPRD
jgi:hypothetical protein